MKITKEQLRQIIKEELEGMEEAQVRFTDSPHRAPKLTSTGAKMTGAEVYSGATGKAAELRSNVDARERATIVSLSDQMAAAAKETNINSGEIARWINMLSSKLTAVLGREAGSPETGSEVLPGTPYDPAEETAAGGSSDLASRAKERQRSQPSYRKGLEESKKKARSKRKK